MYEALTDKRAYANTLGCLMKDPTLVEDIDRPLDREDFNTETFYDLLFVAIYNLSMQGCKTIDEFAIDSYLSGFKDQYRIFQENRGLEYLNNIKEYCSLENYDYYYHRLRKYSLLRYYEKQGLNTKFIYDTSVDDFHANEEQQKFDNYTEQDIVSMVESSLVINPTMKYCTNTLTTEVQAADGGIELIEDLMKIPDVGLPLNNNGLNTVARGARKGCLYMRSLLQGQGKAIPNSTIIPTPNGYKRVDEIREGDYLFGKNGKPTKVLKIHPQPEKKQIYQILFTDGRKAECCEEHLWTYKTYNKGQYKTASLKTIIKEANNRKYGLKDCRNSSCYFKIPLNNAVEYPEKDYSIPPYVMGLLLGDGSFRFTNSNKELSYSSENDYLPNKIATIMNWEVSRNSNKNYTYTFYYKNPKYDVITKRAYTKVRVEDVLKDYPNLIQVYSNSKYIPEEYLLGSINQRYELLKGLIDTDGHVDKKARVGFSTTSKKMSENILTLVRSLGLIGGIREDKRKEHTCYEISITASLDNKLKMVSIPKYVNIIKNRMNMNIVFHDSDSIGIEKIVKTNRFEDMTCFTVDAEDSLFLMNDFIVTHNTRYAAGDACKMAVPYIYDEKKRNFKYTGLSEPTLYITTEMPVDEIQTILYATISKVNEEHILYGTYEKGELERVKQAIEYIESSPLYIVHIPDFSIEDIKNIIKKYNREFGVEYFFFDYISTSLRLMSEINGKSRMGLKEHQLLLVFATELKTIAQQLDVFIFTASQLNGEAQMATYKDQNLLAGSKALANKLDVGIISMRPSRSEQEKLESILQRKFNIPMPDIGHWVYKVRRGRLTHIIIWSKTNLGTMDEEALFVTDFDFNLIDIDFTQIEQVEAKIQEHSVLASRVDDAPVEENDDEPVQTKATFDW